MEQMLRLRCVGLISSILDLGFSKRRQRYGLAVIGR
jgi:hypothetical protein